MLKFVQVCSLLFMKSTLLTAADDLGDRFPLSQHGLQLPRVCALEVIDAGMGQIALYNPNMKSFVAMSNKEQRGITWHNVALPILASVGNGWVGLGWYPLYSHSISFGTAP